MNDTQPPLPDFSPAASWNALRLRADLLRRVRQFFADRGFLEVETPLLCSETVVDRHLDPLNVVLPRDPTAPQLGPSMWLQTSPELAMKRLLAAGASAIYQVTRAFRAAERGPLHNPEFTIVEWYRAGDGPDEAMRLLDDFCQSMLGAAAAKRLSYAEAFRQCVGIDPHSASATRLARAARDAGIDFPAGIAGDDRDAWLDLLLAERVQPNLGTDRPVILYDYPSTQAALARVREGDPPVAERFELYVRGIELANGYHELLDPHVLRTRTSRENEARLADGKPALPGTSRLLAAMEHGLPKSSGVALGFDRLVMIAAGARSIDEVLAFPIERA